MRASNSEMRNPASMIHATWDPYCCWAMPAIASLVGTTPCAPSAPSIIFPNGPRELTTSPAPAPIKRKPRVALIAASAIWPTDLRIAASPTAVMMPMRKAGTLRISLTRNWTMARAMLMEDLRGRCGRNGWWSAIRRRRCGATRHQPGTLM